MQLKRRAAVGKSRTRGRWRLIEPELAFPEHDHHRIAAREIPDHKALGGIAGVLGGVRRYRPRLFDRAAPRIQAADAETGGRKLIDTSSPLIRHAYARSAALRQTEMRQQIADSGAELLTACTTRHPAHELSRFFGARRRRMGRWT